MHHTLLAQPPQLDHQRSLYNLSALCPYPPGKPPSSSRAVSLPVDGARSAMALLAEHNAEGGNSDSVLPENPNLPDPGPSLSDVCDMLSSPATAVARTTSGTTGAVEQDRPWETSPTIAATWDFLLGESTLR